MHVYVQLLHLLGELRAWCGFSSSGSHLHDARPPGGPDTFLDTFQPSARIIHPNERPTAVLLSHDSSTTGQNSGFLISIPGKAHCMNLRPPRCSMNFVIPTLFYFPPAWETEPPPPPRRSDKDGRVPSPLPRGETKPLLWSPFSAFAWRSPPPYSCDTFTKDTFPEVRTDPQGIFQRCCCQKQSLPVSHKPPI